MIIILSRRSTHSGNITLVTATTDDATKGIWTNFIADERDFVLCSCSDRVLNALEFSKWAWKSRLVRERVPSETASYFTSSGRFIGEFTAVSDRGIGLGSTLVPDRACHLPLHLISTCYTCLSEWDRWLTVFTETVSEWERNQCDHPCRGHAHMRRQVHARHHYPRQECDLCLHPAPPRVKGPAL